MFFALGNFPLAQIFKSPPPPPTTSTEEVSTFSSENVASARLSATSVLGEESLTEASKPAPSFISGQNKKTSLDQLRSLIKEGYRVPDLDVRGDTLRLHSDVHPVVAALHQRAKLPSTEGRADGMKIEVAIEGGELPFDVT